MTSIWYLVSCCDISESTLLKLRTFVRNFIWGGTPDKSVWAKVAWDTAIIPTIKGGLKIFDPLAQARALMAKMLTRGLAPGSEPWKTLIQHRLRQLQYRRDGDWGSSELWLFTADKVKPQGFSLWRAIWAAWLAVRGGARRSKTTTRDEKLRQHLYLNPEILLESGQQIGSERKSLFRNWSVKGIHTVQDIWDSGREQIQDNQDLCRRTKSWNIDTLRS